MNRAKLISSVAFAGLALLGANLASATTVQRFSRVDLAKKSDSIVRARVEDQISRRDETNREIYTYITLSVLESVKGAKGEKSITIRQMGGSVDNLISYIPGMPTFKRGEEVVLFLSRKDGAGYPWVMGLQQGKYTVITDENGIKNVRNELSGLRLLAPNGSASEDKSSSEMGLNAFLAGIKSDLNVAGKIQVDKSTPTPIHE
jgi:hypothetical protein